MVSVGLGIGRGGRTYKVKVETLLGHLRKNRERHASIVEKAQAKFREMVAARLEEMLALAKEGKKVQVKVGLAVPTCHTREYDTAIGLLEMTLEAGEETVEIDSDEYERFVMDSWEWVERFTTSNRAYVGDL
jgi:hypothetical protein